MSLAATFIPSLEEIKANPVPVVGKRKKKVDFSLDMSSTCIGWALGVNKNPVARCGRVIFRSTADPGEKLHAFYMFLKFVISVFNPDRLIIEEPPKRRGSTTIRHNELIGVARLVWWEVKGEEIKDSWVISPKWVKQILGVEMTKNYKENKRKMVEKINQLYGLGLKYDKNTTSKLKNEDDVADAIAVLAALYER